MPTDLPAHWSLAEDASDQAHPWRLTSPTGEVIACEDQEQAHGLAWRLEAERLAAGHEPCPHPPPLALLRALCDLVGGQRPAARILKMDERGLRRWLVGEKPPSHAALELLRLAAGRRWP